MDERLEKAIQTANFMATLNTQRRLAFEEFSQSIIYYYNGASFTANRELITFVKTLLDVGYNEAVILDDNNIPVNIPNTKEFLDSILDVYTKSINEYITIYTDIKKKRKVEDLVNL